MTKDSRGTKVRLISVKEVYEQSKKYSLGGVIPNFINVGDVGTVCGLTDDNGVFEVNFGYRLLCDDSMVEVIEDAPKA